MDQTNQPLMPPKKPQSWVMIADSIFSLLAGGAQCFVIDPHSSHFFLLALLMNELTE
jgi:hypothetical protein